MGAIQNYCDALETLYDDFSHARPYRGEVSLEAVAVARASQEKFMDLIKSPSLYS